MGFLDEHFLVLIYPFAYPELEEEMVTHSVVRVAELRVPPYLLYRESCVGGGVWGSLPSPSTSTCSPAQVLSEPPTIGIS